MSLIEPKLLAKWKAFQDCGIHNEVWMAQFIIFQFFKNIINLADLIKKGVANLNLTASREMTPKHIILARRRFRVTQTREERRKNTEEREKEDYAFLCVVL